MKTNVDLTNLNALTPGMVRGIETLLVAYHYACEVQRDHWEFAVELQSLQDTGMNNAELRWLVCKGLVRHAQETKEAVPAPPHRVFRKAGDMIFQKRSCFVLTKPGFETYRQLLPEEVNSPSKA